MLYDWLIMKINKACEVVFHMFPSNNDNFWLDIVNAMLFDNQGANCKEMIMFMLYYLCGYENATIKAHDRHTWELKEARQSRTTDHVEFSSMLMQTFCKNGSRVQFI